MSILSKLFGFQKKDEEQVEVQQSPSQSSMQYSEPKNVEIEVTPDNLPDALRYIVERWGRDYLLNKGFINILNDFHVLKDIQAAKNILQMMLSEGYIHKFLNSSNWELEYSIYAIQYVNDYGTRDDIVSFIIQSFGYGLKYTENKPTFNAAQNQQRQSPNIPQQQPEKPDYRNTLVPYDPRLDLERYQYPPLNLLWKSDDQIQINTDEPNANKDRIIQMLRQFGVEITSIKANIGSTFTLYEIVPAEGTRFSKIRNLEDDIAMSLAVEGVRVIVPIPGKGTVGIEVPNRKRCIVSMESIINSRVYQESTMELPCAIGKKVDDEVFMFDLAKAPHLLVAGATGQGKTVCLNAIITSLLYKKHPAEMKIVMIDPKKVELSLYSPIENHFLARLEEDEDCIITDVRQAIRTLDSLCVLMEQRYDLLKRAHARSIKEYNEMFKSRQLSPEHGHEFMPYIVVIVDEFGDLIMTAGKEVEMPICRLAQLARAVGIHIIIATQRPQASIISGTIKANFPTRIAFKVSSAKDSRVILDRDDAYRLMRQGDMLYLGDVEPMRVQCAFVDTPEVNNICTYIAKQQSFLHPMYLPETYNSGSEDDYKEPIDKGHLDPMFADVAKFVVSNQFGSTSMIQRNYSIGYNRAGKIMDQLERMGVVGPQVGAKPREVLIKDSITLEALLNTL